MTCYLLPFFHINKKSYFNKVCRCIFARAISLWYYETFNNKLFLNEDHVNPPENILSMSLCKAYLERIMLHKHNFNDSYQRKKSIVSRKINFIRYLVLFFKNVSSRERVKPWFFKDFNIIISHIFPKSFTEIP